ncbi:hypothetical protein [Fluoribacter gormanii]|uniref:hypothetical protein n=1 Tax=Fluoribacter gormanii TaxID=464 RepID=UPI00104177B9|nr:hypothetical protein [Fluoribacter gormanii]
MKRHLKCLIILGIMTSGVIANAGNCDWYKKIYGASVVIQPNPFWNLNATSINDCETQIRQQMQQYMSTVLVPPNECGYGQWIGPQRVTLTLQKMVTLPNGSYGANILQVCVP